MASRATVSIACQHLSERFNILTDLPYRHNNLRISLLDYDPANDKVLDCDDASLLHYVDCDERTSCSELMLFLARH